MSASTDRDPLLGEWACLGVLYDEPAHGWAVVKQLDAEARIGRIWHLSRPLTYRALDQLMERGWVRQVGSEPSDAGPRRTIVAATRRGRARFRTWVRTPVPHLRDLRSELLLKLVFAADYDLDIADMLEQQRVLIEEQEAALSVALGHDGDDIDVVRLWRAEVTAAAARFVDRIS